MSDREKQIMYDVIEMWILKKKKKNPPQRGEEIDVYQEQVGKGEFRETLIRGYKLSVMR